MPDVSFFQPGRDYQFGYPRHNFHAVMSRLETRQIKVTEIRDLESQPLDPMTAELQPFLKRCRWLITGTDLTKGAERSFYLESMQNVTPIQ